MRVLFVCTALAPHGGIQRFNRNLVRALRDLGVELDIVIVNDRQTTGKSESDERTRLYGANGSKVRWAARLLRLLLTRRYDRCVCGHLHLAAAFSAMTMLCGYSREQCVLVLHGVEVWDRVVGWRRRGARHFGRVLAVSNFTAKSFLEQMKGFPADAVTIFPNTISLELPPTPIRSKIPEATSVGLRLLSVTRLARSERDKGILDVLAAVATLREKIIVRYVVVGEGDDRVFLEERAHLLGLSRHVEFAGALTDGELWAAYSNADVFILPSRKEGFGIVFLEAMRFGLPVIGAREKGTVDVIQQNVNGLLVDYGDISAISHAVLELASNRALRQRLGKAGKSLVESGGQFSFDAFRARCQEWILAV
jgi:phosphatidylinositol alpha-1,6-mannosyltransferase